VGISSHTVKEWISILEASFIVFRLPPYFENFGKRILKTPKLFFTDVGLVTYLLGIENEMQLIRDPLRGYLVENLVVLELIKWRLNRGLDPHLYYYRDVQKNEIDVIFKDGNNLVPIEIKSSATFNVDFLKGLAFFQRLVGERFSRGYVIYTGELEQAIQSVYLINYKRACSKIMG
jgi:predicted AAA+ superfamily ATPase